MDYEGLPPLPPIDKGGDPFTSGMQTENPSGLGDPNASVVQRTDVVTESGQQVVRAEGTSGDLPMSLEAQQEQNKRYDASGSGDPEAKLVVPRVTAEVHQQAAENRAMEDYHEGKISFSKNEMNQDIIELPDGKTVLYDSRIKPLIETVSRTMEGNATIKNRIEAAQDVNDPAVQELIPFLVNGAKAVGQEYTKEQAEDALDLAVQIRRSVLTDKLNQYVELHQADIQGGSESEMARNLSLATYGKTPAELPEPIQEKLLETAHSINVARNPRA